MSASSLLDDALRFPALERGRLVHELIQSLEAEESEPAADVERVWAVELERRATRALRRESVSRDLLTVCDELDAKRRTRT